MRDVRPGPSSKDRGKHVDAAVPVWEPSRRSPFCWTEFARTILLNRVRWKARRPA